MLPYILVLTKPSWCSFAWGDSL